MHLPVKILSSNILQYEKEKQVISHCVQGKKHHDANTVHVINCSVNSLSQTIT